MANIPSPRYRQADHPRLKMNEWRPEDGAFRISDSILMSKSVTNAYLVITEEGDVVINTGLAGHGQRHRERFEQLLKRRLAVRKVIFTQSHVDHAGGWQAFDGADVDFIGQRNFDAIWAERAALEPFFARRNYRVIRAILDKMARESKGPQPSETPAPRLTTRYGDGYAFVLGGQRFELIATPSGESLDAACVWIPQKRTLLTGNFLSAVLGTMPNFVTLRGDRQRSIPGFLRELQALIDLDAELLITGHGDPLEGATDVCATLKKVRDAVRFIHDKTVRRMVAGETLPEVMEAVELPAKLRLSRLGRGPTRWYVRSIWKEYTGWFRQELTSELYAKPVVSIGPVLAEMVGGPAALAAKAEGLRADGFIQQALHMAELAIAAAPHSRVVRETEARILVDLIDATGGDGFDEIGWLESKLLEAQEALGQSDGGKD
ncbi:alkyl sulfatase BDS1-like metallo-beta-lactamase superfamily hydrolase [Sphingobium xenophagum]|uniref:Alkyl sulfatase BDS1-like metallo-beta-lactamase superfamily hydrolase n=2 Tax=Sphingobium xenophagum TaxID=121428 RepID=A0ABU1X6T1_SPHXE|nr:alkyl sulfatase BDS1-like metallo-beta-lactamase superfamily hydrolase [Sphingobium xenophagum]